MKKNERPLGGGKKEGIGIKYGIPFGVHGDRDGKGGKGFAAPQRAKKDRPESLSFFWLGLNYFRLPRSFTVTTVARSAALTVMSLETVISPLNMEATRAA